MIFRSQAHSKWMYSHASYPIAIPSPVSQDRTRVLFSPRDSNGRSHIAWLDISIDKEEVSIEEICDTPILSPGARGAFDDAGVTIGNVIKKDELYYIYYLGWSLTQTVPFTNFIGLATSTDLNAMAKRTRYAPIVGRSEHDLYSLGYPWVIKDNEEYIMWYGSHKFWGEQGLDMEHAIKRAQSNDGINWKTSKDMTLDIKGDMEFAVSRPCVLKLSNGYHMWYSRRFTKYKPGYAFSEDGITWQRMDDSLTLIGRSDWDSEEISYMSVFEHRGIYYMLYNGNGYGKSGFGIAILENI